MNQQALRQFVQGPLEALRQKRYAHAQNVEAVVYKQCGYHAWNRIKEQDGFLPYDSRHGFGGPEYHAIFRATLKRDAAWKGMRVRLDVQTGAQDIWNFNNPQFLVYLDGQLKAGLDIRHTQVDIPDKQQVQLDLYTYVSSLREDAFLQLKLYPVNEGLEALVYDLSLAYETALVLEPEDEAYEVLSTACVESLKALDFSSTDALVGEASLLRSRQVLSQLSGRSGTTLQHLVALTGHSHIDMAWLWTQDQTREKAIRSYATVLSLMERYPAYIFSSSQMQLLSTLKEDEPALFSKIKERVAEGRWEVEGSMWVESDTILTSGESLVRQIFYGKRWVKQEFGRDNTLLWLPDCFGFPATLVQIMAGTGITGFMTTKLGWNETNRIPHDLFIWKGLDGSQVLAYFVTTKEYEKPSVYPKNQGHETTYNGMLTPSQLLGTWQRFQDAGKTDTLLSLYGYGDGGGGPTEQMLEYEQRLRNGYPGLPRTYTSTAAAFFAKLKKEAKDLPSWFGELYLEYHRGTYTTMAEMKRSNRLCEQEAMQAEFFCSLLWATNARMHYPHARFEQAWKLLLRNQFHDILPGSSIKAVYDRSLGEVQKSIDTFQELIETATKALVQDDPLAVVVFNTTGFDRTDTVSIRGAGNQLLCDENGVVLPSYHDGNCLVALVGDVPQKGWKQCFLQEGKVEQDSPFTYTGNTLSTPFYSVELSPWGTISSLFDKRAGRSVLSDEGNLLTLRADYPKEYDAWNIGKQGEQIEYRLDGDVSYQVVKDTCLCFTLGWERAGKTSIYRQTMTFYAYNGRIDFALDVDWHEEHLMLHTNFFVDVSSPRASYDIAFGVCERTTHTNTSWDEAQREVPAHKWVDVSEERYGVALLSRQSYGYSAKEGRLKLSLLRSPTYPNNDADRGHHQFAYSLLPHQGRFQDAKVIEEGYAIHQGLLATRGRISLAYGSLVRVVQGAVVLETIKKCEDRPSLILRFLQLTGERTSVVLESLVSFKEAWLCNLLEERTELLKTDMQKVIFMMKPHAIQTVELVLDNIDAE